MAELRASGMHFEVLDFGYTSVGRVRPGADFPQGRISAAVYEMLRASAPAVFSHQQEKCPLCAFTCHSYEYALADRQQRHVYTYSHLIFHLIEEHQYLPPPEFLAAIERQFKERARDRPAHDAPPAIRSTQVGTVPFNAPQHEAGDEQGDDGTEGNETFAV